MTHRPRIATLAVTLLIVLVASIPACSKTTTNPGGGGGTGPTFNSDAFSNGKFVFTFTTDGSFGYRCTIHSGMTGTVNVSSAGTDSPLVTVGSGGNVFSPATVSVRTGSYVRWVNSSGILHTVTRP